MSGCGSGAIRVWDLSTGECERTLQGHTRVVEGLVVTGNQLMSASRDKSVREWCLASGACLKVLQAYPAESEQFIFRLVVSGRKLVGGSVSNLHNVSSEYEVVVWDIETLTEEHRLKQPAGERVWSLVAMEGEVWGGFEEQAAVWGRKM